MKTLTQTGGQRTMNRFRARGHGPVPRGVLRTVVRQEAKCTRLTKRDATHGRFTLLGRRPSGVHRPMRFAQTVFLKGNGQEMVGAKLMSHSVVRVLVVYGCR